MVCLNMLQWVYPISSENEFREFSSTGRQHVLAAVVHGMFRFKRHIDLQLFMSIHSTKYHSCWNISIDSNNGGWYPTFAQKQTPQENHKKILNPK
jgi:hypothetical protein